MRDLILLHYLSYGDTNILAPKMEVIVPNKPPSQRYWDNKSIFSSIWVPYFKKKTRSCNMCAWSSGGRHNVFCPIPYSFIGFFTLYTY